MLLANYVFKALALEKKKNAEFSMTANDQNH